MSEEWDSARYAREKRGFIESRSRFRAVYLHTALIFTATWLAGWFCSWLLLRFGLLNMALRYALSFVLAYAVFMGCVRVWANAMRSERPGSVVDGLDANWSSVDGEGCLVVFAGLLLGLVAAGVFAFLGGLPLLLEVAFEVVFAGVVVRRLSRKQKIGDWATALFRNTWPHAVAAWLGLILLAGVLQAKAPQATTFAQAVLAIAHRPAPH